GHMFNHSIETAVYDWPIRRGLGLTAAQFVYIVCAFILNALYTRAQPRKRGKMLVFGGLMAAAWLWIEAWSLVGRLAAFARRAGGVEPPRQAAEAS
ncbi:MAG TPA: hypothetical protein VN783_12125, partial [Thermoanaerobaculia bacterium]|nr:hypothetical protein [Thermoanaerobaculia bacterium]